MKIRDKFILSGIPYDDLDREIIPLLDYLNFKAGIKTKYCCFGHEKLDRLYVMFDDEIDYYRGEEFMLKLADVISPFDLAIKYYIRNFTKGKTTGNWVIETTKLRVKRDRYRICREIITSEIKL